MDRFTGKPSAGNPWPRSPYLNRRYVLSFGHRNGFLFALGGATAAWISGNALLLDRPRIYALFVAIAAVMLIASTITLVV